MFNSTEPGPVQVIQYEGDNSTFVWKSPIEDFNTLSQLIVHESQEAVLFMDGQALDLFGPGRHTLETQNIPLLSRLLNLVGGVSIRSTARSTLLTRPSRWPSAGGPRTASST